MADRLPAWSSAVVVVAHPDDESFGLGAIIDAFVRAGTEIHVLCLTSGEASTLGADSHPDVGELGRRRATEFALAGQQLAVSSARLLAWPDGGLERVDRSLLERDVRRAVEAAQAQGLVVFDPVGGVTGHRDHAVASEAAIAVAHQVKLDVLAWALPTHIAAAMNKEFDAAFVGHPAADLPVAIEVRRDRQLHAIAAHGSQAVPGSPLWRRLELLGSREYLRWR